MEWIKERLKENSTKRSLILLGCGIISIVYAIMNQEPSSAILGVGTTIYSTLNAVTPEN